MHLIAHRIPNNGRGAIIDLKIGGAAIAAAAPATRPHIIIIIILSTIPVLSSSIHAISACVVQQILV